MILSPDLDRALVGVYRGWDRLEREQYGGSVLDFDLAEPAEVPVMDSRESVLKELQRLAVAVREISDDHARELVVGRLQASMTYLDGLRDLDSIPLREYVLNTMGIEPQLQPEATIRSAEHRLKEQLGAYHRGAIPFSKKGFEVFRSEFETGTGENLKRQFEYFCGEWIERLTDQIEAKLDASSINVEFASEDAYWKNWISGNVAEGQPITLRINVHERHIWYQGAVETLVLHEYCGHAVQMALWHDAVRHKRMASFFGVLTVHFPDQFLLEGLAECVSHVLPGRGKSLEKMSLIVRELQRYNLLVLNNVHIIANERSLDAARTYARQKLPFTTDAQIERELRDRTRHPLFRTYQYVYAPAKETFLEALMPLAYAARWPIMRRLYRTPATPAHVREILAGLPDHS